MSLILPSIGAFGHTAAASYSEVAISMDGDVCLISPSTFPSSQKSILIFCSYQSASDIRAAMVSWDGINGWMSPDYSGGDTLSGLRGRIFDDGGQNVQVEDKSMTYSDRMHGLWSAWVDGSNLYMKGAVYDFGGAGWYTAMNTSTTSGAGAILNLGASNFAIFSRSDTTQKLIGDVWRCAIWTSATGTAIADVLNSSVQASFGGSGGIVDPTLDSPGLGTPLVDFYGSASSFNAGTHQGSMGSFTKSGSGSFY